MPTIAIVAAIAAALVVAGGLGVWLWRRSGARQLGPPEQVCAEAEASVPGFRAEAAAIGLDRRGALVVGAGGRVAVVTSGRRTRVCEVRWRDIRTVQGGLVADTGDRRMGSVLVADVDALDIRRIAGEAIAPPKR